MRQLCEALIPLKKTWGCAVTFNVLKDESLVKLMAKAGCRYVYTGLSFFRQLPAGVPGAYRLLVNFIGH